MKETQQESRSLTTGAATEAVTKDPASRKSAGIDNKSSKEDRCEKPTSQNFLQHMRPMRVVTFSQ